MRRLFLVGFLLVLASGCGYYSFSGATIPAHLDTIAIPLVEDRSLSTIPTLDDQLTNELVNRFVRQTRLSLAPEADAADALLLVRIDRYTNQPSAVTGDERAATNRVTLNITARYVDQTKEETLFDERFSAFEDYDPVNDGLEGEEAAAAAALEQLADDIFTKATSDW